MVLIVILIPLIATALTTYSDPRAPATLLEIIVKTIHSVPVVLLTHSAPTASITHSESTVNTMSLAISAPITYSEITAPKTH